MSDLEIARDHARRMSTAVHRDDCRGHQPSRWGWAREIHPDPACPGCISDDDRAEWARQADEIDAYLAPSDEAGLWEEA